MPIVKTKPTSAGRRHVVKLYNPDLHKGRPYQPLVETKSSLVAVTMLAALLLVTLVVVISNTTV